MSKSKAKSVSIETMAKSSETVGTSSKTVETSKSKQSDTLEDAIKNIESWNVKTLIYFLAKNVALDEDELDILAEEKIDGESFFRLTKEELKGFGIKGGPAGRIVALADRMKPKKCCFTLNYEETVKPYEVTYHSLLDLSLKKFQQLVQEAFNLSNSTEYKIIIKYNETVLNSDEAVQFAFRGKEIIALIVTLDKREFYNYKNLKEVLQINGIDGDEVQDIAPFIPVYHDNGENAPLIPVYHDNGENTNGSNENDNDDMDVEDVCLEEIKSILSAIGDVQCDQNEVQRSFIVTAILVAAVNSVENTILRAKIVGNVNYTIKRSYPQSITEDIVCITVTNQNFKEGIAQNIMQIRSTYEASGKKRKLNELSPGYSKYVYGIVTNATEWYFLKYSPDQLSCSHAPTILSLERAQIINDDNLKDGVQLVLGKIICMLEDRNRLQQSDQSNKKPCKENDRTSQ